MSTAITPYRGGIVPLGGGALSRPGEVQIANYQGKAIRVNTIEFAKMAKRINKALGGSTMRQVAKRAERRLLADSLMSFARRADPESGRGWARRRHPANNPLMIKSGGLIRSLFAAAIYKRNAVAIVGGTVDKRVGNRSYHAIGMVHFHGRGDQRGNLAGRRAGGGKGGPIPQRRFVGLTRQSRRLIANDFARALRRS